MSKDLQLAVEFLQPTFTALSKRLSSEQEGWVTPFCSCNRSSISRLAKSLKSPLSSVTRKGRSLDKTPIVLVSSLVPTITCWATPGIKLSKVSCVSAELLAEVIVGLRVACQTIHRVQDYSICFEKVYSLLQTFIATVRYTLQIVGIAASQKNCCISQELELLTRIRGYLNNWRLSQQLEALSRIRLSQELEALSRIREL